MTDASPVGASPVTADAIVIGGGIAGVSVAYELAADRKVLLLEGEQTLAHHTTGRSAAMFLETYGGADVRALTVGSRDFLTSPPGCFESALLRPLPLLQIAVPGRGRVLEDLYGEVRGLVPDATLVSAEQLPELCPLLREGAVELGMYEPGATEIDVHALHQGYVRGMRARGSEIRRESRVTGLSWAHGVWQVVTPSLGAAAPLVVNAAGAWADQVAVLAGCATVGLTPLRRTVFTVPGEGRVRAGLPLLYDVDETCYLKPEGDQFLCSPADRTPSEPCDAKPEQLDIARALDRVRELTVLEARSVRASWAGLRTEAPDGNLVIGHDPRVEGFFWCAGQGGYGIQSAAGAARLAAGLIREEEAPKDLTELGLHPERVAPARFAA